jgi:dihydrofolate reductase
MRKLIMKMSISVDGFVGGANGATDWIFKSNDKAARDWIVDLIWTAGIHIMGRKTFNDMAAYWPVSTEPFAPPMNEIPKGVFTKKGFSGVADPAQTTMALEHAKRYRADRGLEETETLSPAAATWKEARVFSGDLATEIRQLKQEDGKPVFAHGGAGFMQSLAATGLIDEYYLLTHPVALGQGLPLFSGLATPLDLKVVDVKPFPGGAIAHVYQPH